MLIKRSKPFVSGLEKPATESVLSAAAPWRITILMSTPNSTTRSILDGVYAYGRPRHWRLSLRSGWDAKLITQFRTIRTDAFIVLLNNPRIYRWASAKGKPFVGIAVSDDIPGLPAVNPDDHAIGRLGAEHLLTEGFQRFAYFGVDFSYSHRREQGFIQRMEEAGHPVITNRAKCGSRRDCFPTYGRAIGPGLAERWLASLPKPIAIMACSDEYGSRLIDACDTINLRVPEDVAVIGVDNDEIRCRFSPTTLTSVDTQISLAGYQAAQMLDVALTTGKPLPQKPPLVPPARVVQRRSTEWLSGDDPDLDRALRLIRSRAAEGITIEDVLAEVPLSRTAIEQRFRKMLGRTPGEELRRVRLAHVKRLLNNPQLSITQIALQSGFSTHSYLTQFFRQHTGQTPLEFRRSLREGHLA